MTVRSLSIESEMRISATPERVFEALTKEQKDWYPYNYGGDRLKDVVWEGFVGGRVYEDWGDGAGIFYGTVVYHDPPKATAIRGHLRGAIQTEQWFEVVADGDACVVKQSSTFFGEITDEMASSIESHGNLKHMEERFRAYVEGA